MLTLKLLAQYLTLGIGPDEPEAPDQPDPDPAPDAPDAPGEETTDLDAAPDEELDPEPAPRATAKDLREARERAERAERDLQTERQAREAEARQRNAGPSPGQQEFEAEEAKLRDPAVPEMEKWTIRSNRTLRETQQASQAAMREARDLADRTEFSKLLDARPALRTKKYDERVEAKLKEFPGVPRRTVLALLIGDDALKSEQKPRTEAPKKVARGAPLPGRSDVRTNGSKGASAERRKRLEGRNI